MSRRTNKSEIQKAKKQKHNQQKQEHRAQPLLDRKEPTIFQREKILIVCEGTNTEPSYFRQFHLPNAVIEKMEVVGTGYNTLSLVEFAEKLKNSKYPDYEVWCVFDADPKPGNPQQLVNFTNAIKKAEALGYNVAYSNQAFEYWLILHFEDHQGTPMHRDLYYNKINKHIKLINKKAIYDKNSKTVTEDIFNILLGIDNKTKKSRQTLAIERASKIYNGHDHKNPEKEESSTTVFKLVVKLNNKDITEYDQ